MKVSCLLFDLDGTLYSPDNGYVDYTRRNIFRFMVSKGFADSEDDAEKIWRPLFQRFNQSYRGLREGGFEFDREEYCVSQRAGMELYFTRDEPLINLLNSIPIRKVIFTNCREREAEQLMDLLGIRECFDTVYGGDFIGNTCKPEKAAFDKVLDDLKVPPEEIVFFEDSVKNLRTATTLGMNCVLIDSKTAREEGVEVSSGERSREHQALQFLVGVITTLSDGGAQLKAILPQIFEN